MSAGSVGAPAGSTGSAMTDPRPEPRWGQYADVTPPPVEPPPPARPAAAPVRRTWDVVLTTMLLAYAVFEVVGGWSSFANLSPDIQTMFDQFGIGTFTATEVALQWGLAANLARATVLVAVIVVSLLFIRRGRLAFWVPLAGGALAGILVLVCIGAVIASDPAYVDFLLGQQP